jgi:hypothetical protein
MAQVAAAPAAAEVPAEVPAVGGHRGSPQASAAA